MDFHVSNVETDDELKRRAREYILKRVCDKYKLKGDPEFDPEEMEKALRAFDKKFLRSIFGRYSTAGLDRVHRRRFYIEA